MTVGPELLAAYPNIPDAIDYGESDGAHCWEAARRDGLSPADAVAMIKIAAAVVITASNPTISGMPPEFAALAVKLLDQFDHPEFLRYVAAKLGAV